MPIQLKRISGTSPGPRLLISGGVHGDEFEPMAAVRRMMGLVSPDELRGELLLVPVVNEPAFEARKRTAADGKDLARTFPGSPNGTETERIAHEMAAVIREADYYIDLHTGGTALTILPLAGYMLHPHAEVLQAQRKMAEAFNLPVMWGTDYRLQGRSLSVARDANIPAIYTEYGGGGRLSRKGIEANVQGCLNVMGMLGMIERVLPDSRVILRLEDARPESGHLQIANLSPLDGFFEPAVHLGQRVSPGDVLGTVCDVLGETREVIHSRQSGIILVLRTFARVEKGESLAVILESEGPESGSLTEVASLFSEPAA